MKLVSDDGDVFELQLCAPTRPRDALLATYWAMHPRYTFLKSVVPGCNLLDVGAGSGGLAVWKLWGEPVRDDIRMCAIDLVRGEYFDRYQDFQLIDASRERTKFADAAFDAAHLSHVVEHVASLPGLLAELRRLLKPGGKVYIEWPHPASTRFPRAQALAELGILATTVNFFDDLTHVNVLEPRELIARLNDCGFDVLTAGTITNDGLAPQLLSYGIDHRDAEITTYGLWLALRFSTYVIAELRRAP